MVLTKLTRHTCVQKFPDGGATPFRGEKATTWEGGVRVPTLVRWPDRIPAGSVSNGIQTHEDFFTTLATAAGVNNVAAKLKEESNVCIDGINNLDHWTQGEPSKRKSVIYYNESDLTAVRIGNWKSHLMTREGFFDYQRQSSLVFNLRMDLFERHDGRQSELFAMRMGSAFGGQIKDLLTEHAKSLEVCPPRQASGTLRMSEQQ